MQYLSRFWKTRPTCIAFYCIVLLVRVNCFVTPLLVLARPSNTDENIGHHLGLNSLSVFEQNSIRTWRAQSTLGLSGSAQTGIACNQTELRSIRYRKSFCGRWNTYSSYLHQRRWWRQFLQPAGSYPCSCTQTELNKVDVFFRRLKRFGYRSRHVTITKLMNKSNYKFFVR